MYIERLTTENSSLQSNSIADVLEDSTNYYVISDAGLDVFLKSTRNRIAWVTLVDGYTNGFTCIAQTASALYLGTEVGGVYTIPKINLSGNSIANVSAYLSTTTTPAITSDNIKFISIYSSNMLIGTGASVALFNGSDVYEKGTTNPVVCGGILDTKLYYSESGAGLAYSASLPTESDWTDTGVYSYPTYDINNNINCIDIKLNGSSYDASSNKLCLGTENGVYVIDTDETTSLSNAVIHQFGSSLAGGKLDVKYVKLKTNYLYTKSVEPLGEFTAYYSCINLTTNLVVDTFID